MRRARQKANSQGGFVLLLIIILILAGVFGYSGYQVFTILHGYNVAEKEYDSLADNFTQLTDTFASLGSRASAAGLQTAEITTETGEKKVITGPFLDVDFEALLRENDEVVGWLLLEGAGINYPILKGDDNDYFLHHTFSGEYNSSGSIFMDYENRPDFSDLNTFIYGHNMKNGSMFGSMRAYFQSEEAEGEQYFYIFEPNGHRRTYQVYSCYATTSESETYTLFDDPMFYPDYIDLISSQTVHTTDLKLEEDEILPIVTLSTCTGSAGGIYRFVVHGLLIEDVDISSVLQLQSSKSESGTTQNQ